jgi:hypothetical protein
MLPHGFDPWWLLSAPPTPRGGLPYYHVALTHGGSRWPHLLCCYVASCSWWLPLLCLHERQATMLPCGSVPWWLLPTPPPLRGGFLSFHVASAHGGSHRSYLPERWARVPVTAPLAPPPREAGSRAATWLHACGVSLSSTSEQR